MSDEVTICVFDNQEHNTQLVAYLAALHASCIRSDKAITTFKLAVPDDRSHASDVMLEWWKARIAEVTNKCRSIYIALENNSRGRPSGPIGFVMLSMSHKTDKHVGVIEDLCVRPDWRKRAVARKLIEALETDAAQQGRALLTLYTEASSLIAQVYQSFGYVECGRIPRYFTDPAGERKDGTLMYKQLQCEDEASQPQLLSMPQGGLPGT